MPYESPLGAWMSGKEAIGHISTVEKRSETEAVELLRTAIIHRAVGATLADMKKPPIGSSPLSVKSDSVPRVEMWRMATIRVDGTVLFSNSESPRSFQVLRKSVFREWPKSTSARRSGASRASTVINEAISELWPSGLPTGLKAKERDKKIREWLGNNGHSIPSGEHGLQKAVQRAMKRTR
jgi:hypothetical protein